ncbi:TetR/AcrR family transcriptional regulator [Paenibacillus spiritus]|uniref:TetR/AcrR family transcriptional regulator n=1 Tax=Paenibacillus spiritus TaxID=2496557 RepID=UPI00168BFFE6|nr:TetR/AcrR family transcriptional regulator [Paenibacillus spiritus]
MTDSMDGMPRRAQSTAADKPRTPQQDRGVRTREAIIRAAMELFAEKGYLQTNSKHIAARAGVSTGSFYSYFADKKAVFLEVLQIYSEELVGKMEATLLELNRSALDRRTQMLLLIDNLVQSHDVFIRFHKELAVLALSDEELQQMIERQRSAGQAITLKYLQQMPEKLLVRNLEAAAALIYETFDVVVDRMAFAPESVDVHSLKEELADMLVRYLYP